MTLIRTAVGRKVQDMYMCRKIITLIRNGGGDKICKILIRIGNAVESLRGLFCDI
jgi:hypothetical protein